MVDQVQAGSEMKDEIVFPPKVAAKWFAQNLISLNPIASGKNNSNKTKCFMSNFSQSFIADGKLVLWEKIVLCFNGDFLRSLSTTSALGYRHGY